MANLWDWVPLDPFGIRVSEFVDVGPLGETDAVVFEASCSVMKFFESLSVAFCCVFQRSLRS